MKLKAAKIITFLLLSLIFIPSNALGAEIITNGNIGTQILWQLDENGLLTIKGSGEMQDFDYYTLPWRAQRNKIKEVIIENGITSIGAYSFNQCTNLTRITLPDSIERISAYAFLETAYYLDESNWDNNVLYIDEYLISAKTDITGSYTIKDGTSLIADAAFENCSLLEKITFPDSTKTMGKRSFYKCTSLKEVTFPDYMESIDSEAFSNCTSLTEISLPLGIEEISSRAFFFCTSLKNINFPLTLNTVGVNAFGLCEKLEAIEFPVGITVIDSFAFSACDSLDSIKIPDTYVSISHQAFNETKYYLNKENYKDGLLYIGNHLIKADPALTGNITLKNTTINIIDRAFEDCTQITQITIPKSLKYIGSNAFFTCTSLEAVNISDTEAWFSIFFTNEKSNPLFMGATLTLNGSELTDITVPEAVTRIRNYTFYGYDKLKALHITENVKEISSSAFYGCSSLDYISIDEKNPYFCFCENAILNIEKTELFFANTKESVFEIPKNIKTVHEYAFSNCRNLTEIIFPKSIIDIKDNALLGCTSLEKIYIHNDSKPLFTNWINGADARIVYYFTICYKLEDETTVYENVVAGEDAKLLNPPSNSYFSYTTSDGLDWSGKAVSSDADITVKTYSEEIEIISHPDLFDIKFDGNIINAKTYYDVITDEFVVSEGTTPYMYLDAEKTMQDFILFIPRDKSVTTVYVDVISKNNNCVTYTVNITREIITDLGDIAFFTVDNGTVTVSTVNKIKGEPLVSIYKSTDGLSWTRAITVSDFENNIFSAKGFEADTKYFIKLVANYRDTPYAESNIIEVTTPGFESSADIISVTTPENASIDHTTSSVNASVANKYDKIKIEVKLHEGATWALYYTENAKIPIENNTLTLSAGHDTTAYIKVTSADKTATKNYKLTIYRKIKSKAPVITFDNGYITITSETDSGILYTINDSTLSSSHGSVYREPFAVKSGDVVRAIAINRGVADEFSDVVVYIVEGLSEIGTNECIYFRKSDNGFEWSFYIISGTDEPVSGTLWITACDSKGKILDIMSEEINGNATEKKADGEFLTKLSEADHFNVFFWDTKNNMVPLCNTIKITELTN